MKKEIDARGLACPQPVILTQKALEDHGEIVVIVDNETGGRGVKILVCGTCLGYFEIKDQLAAGTVSNMYDIAEAMLGAGRLVRI